jgi:hypothetical protein
MTRWLDEWKEIDDISNVFKPPYKDIRIFQFAGTKGGFWSLSLRTDTGAWYCVLCHSESCRHVEATKRFVEGKCGLCDIDSPHKHDPSEWEAPPEVAPMEGTFLFGRTWRLADGSKLSMPDGQSALLDDVTVEIALPSPPAEGAVAEEMWFKFGPKPAAASASCPHECPRCKEIEAVEPDQDQYRGD